MKEGNTWNRVPTQSRLRLRDCRVLSEKSDVTLLQCSAFSVAGVILLNVFGGKVAMRQAIVEKASRPT